MKRLENPADWLLTGTGWLRCCLALVVLVGLCLFFAACDGTTESGFTPGTESLRAVSSGPESERDNDDGQPFDTSPTSMADPEDPTSCLHRRTLGRSHRGAATRGRPDDEPSFGAGSHGSTCAIASAHGGGGTNSRPSFYCAITAFVRRPNPEEWPHGRLV